MKTYFSVEWHLWRLCTNLAWSRSVADEAKSAVRRRHALMLIVLMMLALDVLRPVIIVVRRRTFAVLHSLNALALTVQTLPVPP